MTRTGELLGSAKEAAAWAVNLKVEYGISIVLTNGNYDLLHFGHIRFLQLCAAYGFVIVAVDTDKNVQNQKGPSRPIVPCAERMAVLAAVRFVDAVFPFEGDVTEVVRTIKPDILVKGADWQGRVRGQDVVEAYGGRVVLIDLVELGGVVCSTTSIINKIRACSATDTPA